jgi:hypothetical protein
LKDLLPVIDNLDRALDLGDRTGKWESLAEGVRMTRKLLEDTLAKQGLKAFTARGSRSTRTCTRPWVTRSGGRPAEHGEHRGAARVHAP